VGYYKDSREHITALEQNGKLVRVKREINKDTELMPLVRWQFRGLPEEERKAFLFENVVDGKGKKYNIPVLVASHAASRDVYAIGMQCAVSEIMEKWAEALRHPIEPRLVKDGPVHEEVHIGDTLLEHGGLSEFPVPISTPGFDNAPYFTAANWVTKDPETGKRNVGNYRGMIKSQTRCGIQCQLPKHLRISWEKCKRAKKPLQAAIVIGTTPAIGYAGAKTLAYGLDEFSIAGGIAGEAIELVKCKTVDLEVPATAEIVIEGELPTDSMEREGPFGEYTGYMAPKVMGPYFNVTCITHRKNPIYTAFISQFPPSESSKLRQIGDEANLFKYLKYDSGLPVTEVALHESCGSTPFCVVSMHKNHISQAWRVLNGVVALTSKQKIVIVVDDDIDPKDSDSVNWAISFRVQPQRDIRFTQGSTTDLDPSLTPVSKGRNEDRSDDYRIFSEASSMLINATTKWDYPPVSLPKKQYMERAKQIWEEEGLPKLKPKTPWYGYSLGYWTEEFEEEARLAQNGQYLETGEKLAKQRIKLNFE
jgi:4-hydroxy-3-polyprenylbenzoate decarboxylase